MKKVFSTTYLIALLVMLYAPIVEDVVHESV